MAKTDDSWLQIVLRLGNAFRWRVWTTFQDGTGWYLIAIIFLACAGAAFVRAFSQRERQEQTISKLLTNASTVGRDEQHGVLASSLAAAFSVKQLLDPCSPSIVHFTEAIRHALEEPHDSPSITLSACTPPKCPSAENAAWTDDSTRTDLRIPSTLVQIAEDPANHQMFRQEATRSRLLDELVLVPRGAASGSRLEPVPDGVAAVYYISNAGIMRYWPAGGLARVAPNTEFRSAAHVFHAHEDTLCGQKTGSASPPYLDLNGLGVVRTACLPVRATASGPSRPDKANSILVGTLCVDLSPGQKVVESTLYGLSDVFVIYRIDAYLPTPRRQLDLKYCTPSSDLPCTTDGLEPPPVKERDGIAKDVERWLGNADPSSNPQRFGTIRVLNDDGLYGVVLRSEAVPDNVDHPRKLVAAVLRARDLQTIAFFPLALGLLSLVLAAGMSFIAHWRHTQRQQIGILRSAPMPVIVTEQVDDHTSIIRYGNDAAEALFARELPSLKLVSKKNGVQVEVDEASAQLLAAEHGKRKVFRSSEYIITLKDPSMRVQVVGSSLQMADGRALTYGVLRALSPDPDSKPPGTGDHPALDIDKGTDKSG